MAARRARIAPEPIGRFGVPRNGNRACGECEEPREAPVHSRQAVTSRQACLPGTMYRAPTTAKAKATMLCYCGGLPAEIQVAMSVTTFSSTWPGFSYSCGSEGPAPG